MRPSERALGAALLLLAIAASPARAEGAFDPAHTAHVIAVRNGRVTIQLVKAADVGDHFALVPVTFAEGDDVARYTICEIDRVTGLIGSAELERGAHASVGDLAIPTGHRPVAHLIAPTGWRNFTSARILARPTWVESDGGGFALLGEIAIDHHFTAPLHVGVALEPASLISSSAGTGQGMLLLGRVGYDGDLAELGATIGYSSHTISEDVGFVWGARLRVGALDGFHAAFELLARTASDGTTRSTVLNSFTAEIDLPVHRSVTLGLSAGGSSTWSQGSFLGKIFLSGQGAPGTFILIAGIGVVSVTEIAVSNFNFGVKGIGPSLTLGLEVRL